MSWYRFHDSDPDQGGMLPITRFEARAWNEKGYGIFASVQSFKNGRRIAANLDKIRAWAVDIDDGTKEEQKARIRRSPLFPSSIVETKNGYHVYFYAQDATPGRYRTLLTRLVDTFRGDPRARDVARVLRVPGYYHMKNPSEPFMVRHAYGPYRDRKYTEREMFRFFQPAWQERKKALEVKREFRADGSDDFWDAIYNLDCRDALERLSGTGYVNGERFSFRNVCGGTKQNIVVDGKGTSCWIDSEGRIGSPNGGGPTVIQWLAWYGMPKRDCVRVVKELYPSLSEIK